MSYPRARTDQLVVQELPEETLVFDQRNNKAHCLNRVTALIWKHCDGRTDLPGLARLLEAEVPAGADVLMQLALEQLAARHLLEVPVQRGSAAQRRSRRELLKQLAAAAVALPVILTVAAPRANAAGSQVGPTPPTPPPTCPPGQTMCSTGCKTLQTDTQNCGTCAHVCAPGTNVVSVVCSSGNCGIGSCAPGFANCNGSFASGCNVNTSTDPSNCGGCGIACGPQAPCVNGRCGNPP